MSFLLPGNARQLRFTGEFKANAGEAVDQGRDNTAAPNDQGTPPNSAEAKLGQVRARKTTMKPGLAAEGRAPSLPLARNAIGQPRSSHRATGAPRQRLDSLDDESPTTLLPRDGTLSDFLPSAPEAAPAFPAAPFRPTVSAPPVPAVEHAPIMRLASRQGRPREMLAWVGPISPWVAGAVAVGAACYFLVPELFALFN